MITRRGPSLPDAHLPLTGVRCRSRVTVPAPVRVAPRHTRLVGHTPSRSSASAAPRSVGAAHIVDERNLFGEKSYAALPLGQRLFNILEFTAEKVRPISVHICPRLTRSQYLTVASESGSDYGYEESIIQLVCCPIDIRGINFDRIAHPIDEFRQQLFARDHTDVGRGSGEKLFRIIR